MSKRWSLVILIVLIWGCVPGDSVELPAQRPYGTIKGKVVDGAISNATVNIFAIDNHFRGTKLGSGTTDSTGEYTIDIQAHSQSILVEVSGGSYIDLASGNQIQLEDGQILRAVANYQSGQQINVMVTPITHWIAGLSEFYITNNIAADTAVADAIAGFNDFFNLNALTTQPADINAGNSGNSSLNDALSYGFYLAGYSYWTQWVNNANSTISAEFYTSIALAQILYNDVRADGLINGIGYNKENTALIPLALGVVPLSEDTYRLIFSVHMLEAVKSTNNNTGLLVTDLVSTANSIATQTKPLINTDSPLDLAQQAPELNVTPASGEYFSGQYHFEVNVGGILGAEHIYVYVDDVLAIEYADIPTIDVSLDSSGFTDGSHQIRVTAENALGIQTSQQFTVLFDNTAPTITINAPTASKQTPLQISGTYNDNVTGIDLLTVQGQPASLLEDGTWVATVDLVDGENAIAIAVADKIGNQYQTDLTLYLDTIAPEINALNKHSLGRFSSGDGSFFEAQLQDSNIGAPLYIETNNLALDGVMIDRQQLVNNAIPFFAFTVSDQLGPTATSPSQDLQVRMQYEINGTVISPWHPLDLVENEYLIPLAAEMLTSSWHQTVQSDEHVIKIEVSDIAGNITTTNFDFQVDFFVPLFSVDSVVDLGEELFLNTPFAQRQSLNTLTFSSTEYGFTNNIGYAFYMQLADNSSHETEQSVEKLVREHLINLKTTTEWQLGLMTLTNQCPEMTQWTSTTSVWNWKNNAWSLEQVPDPSYATPTAIYSDLIPASPPPSNWSNVADFDQDFKFALIDSPPNLLSYSYDYVLTLTDVSPPGAYVFAWQLQSSVSLPPITISCPPKRYFQQRLHYNYESVTGYPKPVLTLEALSNLPTFSTQGFTVTDNTTGLEIDAVGSWYLIPAGHSISIVKLVSTPDLILYNDDISNVTSFPSYTPNLYDKTLQWHVNRNISIITSHDAGEANITQMSTRVIGAGEGIMDYQISR